MASAVHKNGKLDAAGTLSIESGLNAQDDMSKTGFQRAGDLVAVHGKRGNAEGPHRPPGWVSEEYTSIPAAIFMLAYAAGDGLVARASKQHGILGGRTGHDPLGLGSQGLVTAWAQAGHPLLARARVTPRDSTGIHRWHLLDGEALAAYLSDACLLRNRLDHTGTTAGVKLRSPYFTRGDTTELRSMTLMLAEGMLQAAQDIAYLTLSAPAPAASGGAAWKWVLPRQSGTGTMPWRMWRDKAFPLPEDNDPV